MDVCITIGEAQAKRERYAHPKCYEIKRTDETGFRAVIYDLFYLFCNWMEERKLRLLYGNKYGDRTIAELRKEDERRRRIVEKIDTLMS